MKADRQYIERKFEEFNRQMFAGKLPPIPIELSDAKTFLGQCVFKIRRTLFGKTEKYDNAQLYIDNAGLVLNRLLSEIGIKGKVVEISLSMDGIGN